MKSLTEEFVLLRSNAIRRRHFQNESVRFKEDSEVVRLLNDEDDEERGIGGSPSFVGPSEALQYQISRLEAKISELDDLQKHHLAKPSFSDTSTQEEDIKRLGKEISEMFHSCNHQLKQFRRSTACLINAEMVIAKNVVNYLANRLQDASERFGKSQTAYLNRMKTREEIGKNLFDLEEEEDGGAPADDAWTMQSLVSIEDHSRVILRREKEINSIVQSIGDLNAIFKDLAQMVTEQGEMIDRIDYNIEHAHIKVQEGVKQLEKAAMYQKQDRKMHCIVLLAVIVIILLIILIVAKT